MKTLIRELEYPQFTSKRVLSLAQSKLNTEERCVCLLVRYICFFCASCDSVLRNSSHSLFFL
ncbi:hypothetical protein B9Z19DRAFT_1083873 [Tuber borchii]|uniref:Uncharacterized protein n=1 Tax=Tuber borchii TaxID=42251 RepID=A0A2T6ZSW0_TUBBO|nr:hypothetical protein B9Z19DRAFT_1083873 [Tuber borchii]